MAEGVIQVFQLAFQLVPRFLGVDDAWWRRSLLPVRLDAGSGRKSPSRGPGTAILRRNVPTCVPTCSNSDLGVSTVPSDQKFWRFFGLEKLRVESTQKKFNLVMFQLFQLLLQRKVYNNVSLFILWGGRTSWNLEHFGLVWQSDRLQPCKIQPMRAMTAPSDSAGASAARGRQTCRPQPHHNGA